MATPSVITQARLKELLHYNPKTGVFTRLVATAPGHVVGEVVGRLDARGYLRMMLDRRQYKAHRLAWLYVKGEWPTAEIDHRNEKHADNRFRNLREATSALNKQNHRGPQKNSTSGARGVSRSRNKWRVRVGLDGRNLSLGCFTSKAEAKRVYREAKVAMHPFAT